MDKSKLIIVLKTLTPDELKRFSDFIHSPYFNKSKTVIRFFSELKKLHPEFETSKLSKEIVYKKMFPGKKLNEQVMKNLISDLYKLCKEFLTIEFGRQDNFENRLNLLKQMVLRKADPVFSSELKLFENELKEAEYISDRSFYYLFQLEETKISFHLERNQQPLVFDKVLHSGEYLILFFLLHLTKTISNLNVNKQTFNAEYESNLPANFFSNTDFEKIIGYMKENNIPYSYVAELYYYRVVCNSPPYDENYYFKFKSLLIENLKLLGRVEVYGLFNALETFCMRKINTGHSEFVKELFDVFNTEMNNDIYKYSDTSPLTYMKFRNTYLCALSLRKNEWVEKFIAKYKNDLIEPHRESIVRIAEAQLEFEKGNYAKVLENLSQINSELVYLKTDIRSLTIMSYYELKYFDSVLSGIDSFKHFLSKNKTVTEHFKESHLRFLNALGAFILSSEKSRKDEIAMLKETLMQHRNERRIEWLIGKME